MTVQQCIENERGTLDFVRRRPAGRVHVVVQRGPNYDPNPEFEARWERANRRWTELSGPITSGEVLALSPKLTMCGQVLGTAPGVGSSLTDCFNDADLCGACRRTLGDQANRAFEHQQPGDPEEHDDCAGDLL